MVPPCCENGRRPVVKKSLESHIFKKSIGLALQTGEISRTNHVETAYKAVRVIAEEQHHVSVFDAVTGKRNGRFPVRKTLRAMPEAKKALQALFVVKGSHNR